MITQWQGWNGWSQDKFQVNFRSLTSDILHARQYTNALPNSAHGTWSIYLLPVSILIVYKLSLRKWKRNKERSVRLLCIQLVDCLWNEEDRFLKCVLHVMKYNIYLYMTVHSIFTIFILIVVPGVIIMSRIWKLVHYDGPQNVTAVGLALACHSINWFSAVWFHFTAGGNFLFLN